MDRLRIAALALAAGVAVASPSFASVWLSSGAQILEIDARSGSTLDTVALAPVSSMASTADGRLWVLTKNQLQLLESGRTAMRSLDLASLGYSAATLLAVNPYDHSVWVATADKLLLRVNQDALPTGTFVLPDFPRAAALDNDETLWVAGDAGLWHLNEQGQVIAQILLPDSAGGTARSLSIDALGRRVWVADENGIVAIDSRDAGHPRITTSVPLAGTRGAAMDTRSGVLWVLTGAALNALGREGRLMAAIPLSAVGAEGATALGFDAEQEIVVLGGAFGVIALTSTGSPLFAMRTDMPVAPMTAAPWVLRPSVAIEQPVVGMAYSDTHPELVLQLGALCSGAACQLGSEYLSGLRLSVTLDGQPIDLPFTLDTERSRMQARPATALSPGRHVISVQVTDVFGHHSETVDTFWTLDAAAAGADTLDAALQARSTETSDAVSRARSTQTSLAKETSAQAAKGKNIPPTVVLTAPQASAIFPAGAPLTLTATAADADGSVARVDFLAGDSVIGSDVDSPYSVEWNSVPEGNHSLTARATDNKNATGTSAAVEILVTGNQPPSVILSAPPDQSVVEAGTALSLAATADDADGLVTQVQFYAGEALLATDMSAPFEFTWEVVPAGAHVLSAKATDDGGAVVSSGPVNVLAVESPLVVLTSPGNCARVDAPGNIQLSADAEAPGSGIAKVEFFQGTALVGAGTTPPYAATVNGLAAGVYAFTAKATSVAGLSSIARPIEVTVGPANMLPSVSLTSPVDGATFAPAPTITLTADAVDSDGDIASVAYFANDLPLGTAVAAPYAVTWSNAPSGTHTLTAVATDDRGGMATSAPVQIVVDPNSPPSISITAPAAGAIYYAPARIDLSALATDVDGAIVRVEFFLGSTVAGVAMAAPYEARISGVAAGTYAVTAVATDDLGAQSNSTPVNVTVLPNEAPSVTLTEPAGSDPFFAPATLRVSASASDSDGSIQSVEFYAGAELIGTADTAPYSIVWDDVAIGSYLLTAVAVDDSGGATTSAPIAVTVQGSSLTILEPVVDPTYGIAGGTGSVYVRGTLSAPPNSSVVVNGKVAVIDDAGQFHVNHVPLDGEVTTVTATLLTQDGLSASRSIDVVNGGAPAFSVWPDADWGLNQKEIIFTTVDPGVAQIARFEYDFNSDGVADYTADPSDFTDGQLQLALTYPQPGRYIGRVTAYDTQNQAVLTARHAIVMKDPIPLGNLLQGVFDQMLERLRAGNVEGALTSTHDDVKARYRDIFNALLPEHQEELEQLGVIADGQLSEEFAELALVRTDPVAGDAAYLMYMSKGEDGIWRIDSM